MVVMAVLNAAKLPVLVAVVKVPDGKADTVKVKLLAANDEVPKVNPKAESDAAVFSKMIAVDSASTIQLPARIPRLPSTGVAIDVATSLAVARCRLPPASTVTLVVPIANDDKPVIPPVARMVNASPTPAVSDQVAV